MAEGESTDVRVKLVLDDQASAATSKYQHGMGELFKSTLLAQQATQMLGGGAAMLAGPYGVALEGVNLLKEGIKQAADFMGDLVKESLKEADAANSMQKEIAGTLTLLDGGKHSMGELRNYSAGVAEELGEMGLRAGKTRQEMVNAYEQIVERGQIGSEQAKELAGDMALVGKLTRGGMDSLTMGFAQMEMGMVRAKNPLVQLIAMTGTLHGNAREVAAQMQKMTPEKQMDLAQQAISAQAEKMRAGGAGALGPMSLGAAGKTFDIVKEQFLESMGQPMLAKIIPPLTELRKFLIEHSEEIAEYGRKVGAAISEVIGAAIEAGKGLYEGVKQNWGELRDIFEATFGDFVKAWHSAAGDAADIRTQFRIIGDDLVKIFEGVMYMVRGAIDYAMDAKDLLNGDKMGTSRYNMTAKAADTTAQQATFGDAKTAKELETAIDRYRALGKEIGKSDAEIDDYSMRLRQAAQANEEASHKAKEALDSGNYDAFNQYLEGAIKTNTEGAERFAFSAIAGSQTAMQALLNGSIHIAGGLDSLMQVIDEKAPELAAKLRKLGDTIKNEGGVNPKGGAGGIHMSGGQTFNIKQDFRDQDADRVFFQFRSDIVKHATARIQARTQGAFGAP